MPVTMPHFLSVLETTIMTNINDSYRTIDNICASTALVYGDVYMYVAHHASETE